VSSPNARGSVAAGPSTGERFHGTVVVGGGQAGLAVGYHLRRRGLPFVILDAHPRVGDAWRTRWDSLRVFTPAQYDALPGMRFPAPRNSYPGKDQVADYLESYAERFELPIRTGTTVDAVRREGDGYRVVSGSDSWRAENVVVATSAYHTPRVPPFASELDPETVQIHSKDYRRPGQLQAGETLVVGAGNSGAEIAMELSQRHRVWLSGRDTGQEPVSASGTLWDRLVTPLIWFAANHVLRPTNPLGRKARAHFLDPPRGIPLARVRRRDLLDAGVERVPRTAGVEGGRPVLDDGRVLDVGNVVWCTGFRPDFGWVELPIFGEYGLPRHERGVVPTQPGLYFAGLPFQSALASSLIGGVGRDARYVAKRIAQRTARSRPGEASVP
jgi:putative flavoprotein involved in K+ transport